MPNINDAFPSNYIKASDLQGKELIVTISGVEMEAVGREKDMKAVIYFVGKKKGMVLNKTNARKIIEIAGSAVTEEWPGVQIKLYPTETEFGGETVDCIRVKPLGKPALRMQKTDPAASPKSNGRTATAKSASVEEEHPNPPTEDTEQVDLDDIPF